MSRLPQIVPLSDGRGVVASFDDPRGIGVIRRDDGTEYPFHCTSVANGSRSIAAGSNVFFSVAAGRIGRWEAIAIVEVGD